MKLPRLRDFTSARVGIGRAGNSLPTAQLLQLQIAHARARQAVHSHLDVASLTRDLEPLAQEVLVVQSAALDRGTYLRRPDLGRQLNQRSRYVLADRHDSFDVCFILADGLSALAVERHAVLTLAACLKLVSADDWTLAPLVIAEQARVAIGDEIGHGLGAALSIVLIGERPGLSSFDSLGIYLTWNPHPGTVDSARNCISNIRTEGLSYATAAHKLAFLMHESRRRKLSGIGLKENAALVSSASADQCGSSFTPLTGTKQT